MTIRLDGIRFNHTDREIDRWMNTRRLLIQRTIRSFSHSTIHPLQRHDRPPTIWHPQMNVYEFDCCNMCVVWWRWWWDGYEEEYGSKFELIVWLHYRKRVAITIWIYHCHDGDVVVEICCRCWTASRLEYNFPGLHANWIWRKYVMKLIE